MAKALFGHATAADPRELAQLTLQNRLLRRRVADLEEMVVRLSRENDHLAAQRVPASSEVLIELEPASAGSGS